VKLAEAAGQFVCCSSNCRISHALLAFCLGNWGFIVSDMHAGCVSVVLASCETCMLSCTKLADAVVGAGHACSLPHAVLRCMAYSTCYP
jgi:hypothetical protein